MIIGFCLVTLKVKIGLKMRKLQKLVTAKRKSFKKWDFGPLDNFFSKTAFSKSILKFDFASKYEGSKVFKSNG